MNLKLSLIGADTPSGLMLRFENRGTSPAAVIRSCRPGYYAGYDLEIRDAEGHRVSENIDVMCCGTPYPLTADALVVIPPGEARDLALDTAGYDLPPGRYRVRATYRTHADWLAKVDPKPAGFEHLAQGEWTSNDVLTK